MIENPAYLVKDLKYLASGERQTQTLCLLVTLLYLHRNQDA